MWAVANGDRDCPLLSWLSHTASRGPPIQSAGLRCPVMMQCTPVGTHCTRQIHSREDVSEWIHRLGFPQPRWGAHFRGRAQERTSTERLPETHGVQRLSQPTCRLRCMHASPKGCHRILQSQRVSGDARATTVADTVQNSSWEAMDTTNVQEFFHKRYRVMQTCPHHVRGRFREAVRSTLEARRDAVRAHNGPMETRAWKVFCLLFFLLLRRPPSAGHVSREELCDRFDEFSRGEWLGLYEDAVRSDQRSRGKPIVATLEAKARAVCAKVRMGEVSRVAPGTHATLRAMQGRRPQETLRAIPAEVLNFEPQTPVVLDRSLFLKSSARRGSSPGPGGYTYEHFKVLINDTATFELFFELAPAWHRPESPLKFQVHMSARMTALTKDDAGVRGIATGCTLRRLVARTLARQFSKDFEDECAPFQYALSTRAGTDCVGHMLRVATDRDHRASVLKVDGIGAYDHVLRAAMLGRLAEMTHAQGLIPFVKMSYGAPSAYSWFDDEGTRHEVTQAEGGEQGDPLLPLLFSIGIQGALEEVALALTPEEQICAFLDDVYIICQPERVRSLFDLLWEVLFRVDPSSRGQDEGVEPVWNCTTEC